MSLIQYIKFSQPQIDIQYTKGTGTAIQDVVLGVQNISMDTDIQVTFVSDFGVSFNPKILEIPKNSQQSVKVQFDTSKIENLQDGLTRISCVVNLSSTTEPAPQQPTGTTKWFNVTKNVWVNTLPVGASICPPGSTSFYEFGDRNLLVCLKNQPL